MRTDFRHVITIALAGAALLLASDSARAGWQIEYSDRMVGAIRQWGHSQSKRVGYYATRAACEDALRRGVAQSGDSNLARHAKCVGFDDVVAKPKPAPAQTMKPKQGLAGAQGQDKYKEAERLIQEEERQKVLEREKAALLASLKGVSPGGAGTLALKPIPDRKPLKTPPEETASPKVSCEERLREWHRDPARNASETCECLDPERPPLCAPKGQKLPDMKEGAYSINWRAEIRNAVGSAQSAEGRLSGRFKNYGDALKACRDDARRAAPPPQQVVNLVCSFDDWPGLPKAVRAPRKALPVETGLPKIDCDSLLKEWRNDPARKAAEDCRCLASDRPPVCVQKGGKMPEVKEGGYAFHWMIEIRTSDGHIKFNDGTHSGRYRSPGEAVKGCEEEARASAEMLDHVASLVCIPTMWPQMPQGKTSRSTPALKQGK